MRPGTGPIPAPLLIVGEAFGEAEEARGLPFVGPSGHELDRMLREAGLDRASARVTNLVNARPPHNNIEEWIPAKKKDVTPDCVPLLGRMVKPIVMEGHHSLLFEIEQAAPRVILTLGKYALWALTGLWGIDKWRGSPSRLGDSWVLPTYHPAYILRQWSERPIAIHDLRRAARLLTEPYPTLETSFLLDPSYATVMETLSALSLQPRPLTLNLDIETSLGHIECLGLGWSPSEAICIPFISQAHYPHHWTEAEEVEIVRALRALLTAPGVAVRWQNGLYDAQYLWRHWRFVPNRGQDTMIAWHTLFPGMRKSLDFQASLLCPDYTQWKPDRVKQKEGG